MTDHIITYNERIGSQNYFSGDRLDVENAIQHGLLNESLLKSMKKMGRVSELTPETFRIAIARRHTGLPWPPAGFTQAELEERGLIEKGFSLAPPEPKRSEAEVPRVIDTIELTDEKVAVGAYFLQPKKGGARGQFTFWSAADGEGRLLRAKGFRDIESGTAFLVDLAASAEGQSTESPPADTSEDEEASEGEAEAVEQADGSDLRSGSGGPEGQDPPADR